MKIAKPSSLRAAWYAELRRRDEMEASLIERMYIAQRAGDQRTFAKLVKELFEGSAPMVEEFFPGGLMEWPAGSIYRKCADLAVRRAKYWKETLQCYPLRLRDKSGGHAWRTLKSWRQVHEREKRDLVERLEKSRGAASYMLLTILRHLMRDDNGEFFEKLSIAFEEEKSSSSTFVKLKRELVFYRNSLLRSNTPGKPRHTKAEIKEIVAPNARITKAVWGNMIREFQVPHLVDKRGRKPSPHYRSSNNGARPRKTH